MCGKFASLRFFDPGGFDSDIYAVDVRGLGRGKGVEVVSRTSVLDVPDIVVPIKNRCRELIRIIDGKLPPTKDEIISLQRDLQLWKESALDLRKEGNDQQAQLVDMERNMLLWKKKAQTLSKRNRDFESKIVEDESTMSRWINHCDKLSTRVNDLTLENNRLTKKIENMTEEEDLEEEMEEILEMINSSANTDYEYLIDAVRFLLEVG